MTLPPIDVIGIGLGGLADLPPRVVALLEQADWLVGSARQLALVPDGTAQRLELGAITETLERLAELQQQGQRLAVLASGDPLFFGLGRLLRERFPADQLCFHPHLSSIQLAFARLGLPWQEAEVISLHGRPIEPLIPLLQRGRSPIACLTDGRNSPGAIAALLRQLDLDHRYDLQVCENLGDPETERVWQWQPDTPEATACAELNVVVLVVRPEPAETVRALPQLGLRESDFLGFRDRPGLITKREVRVLALAELELQPGQVVWDIGAGTGSVACEIARLCPDSQVFAIERSAAGQGLIRRNAERLGCANVSTVAGRAPEALADLPAPDRVFIGGSGGELGAILDTVATALRPGGLVVLALATLEHLAIAQVWFSQHRWSSSLLQVQLSRSTRVAGLTRFSPLNPVTVISARPEASDAAGAPD